ncbi:MAG: TonB-dependent receptor [Nitrospirae bacterium]|nr:TonB-dependent receptor [Nitrospirota bacterium]
MKRFLVVFLMLVMASAVWAEEKVRVEEVVVTAGRIEEPSQETTSDVVVIKEEEIKKMNVQFVADVLRQVSELNLIQSGGKGKLANVLIRGGSSEHTMVMIDGIRVKSTTTGSYDFSDLTVDDIERIEIVKGPQSTIYGSEAMAGVINIITKKGKGKPKTELSFEAGSFSTYKPSLSVSGGTGKISYRLNSSYLKTDGISTAKSGTERDGYENAFFSGKLGIKVKENLELEFTGRHSYDLSELDARSSDDPNYIQRGYHSMLSGRGKLYLFDKWEQVLTLSSIRDSLEYRDPDTSRNNSDISTGMDTVDWQNNLYLSDSYTLTAGAEYREEQGENRDLSNNTLVFDKIVDNKAIYLNNKLKTFKDNLILNAGLRYDEHETSGDKTTYKVGALYEIKPFSARVRLSYGTGFRAPTLNELFYQDSWGSSGNPNLKPEKSTAWEVGAEKDIDKASISLTYFQQDYEDLIQWTEVAPWTWQPQNVRSASVKGIESSLSLKPIDILNISMGYTHLNTEDKSTHKKLPRRPNDKFALTGELSKGKYTLRADYLFVGSRADSSKSTGDDLPWYGIVNLSGSYNVTKSLSLFGRIENLGDVDYVEAKGYGTPGRSFYGGIKAVF